MINIKTDSRKVKEGDTFVAIKGYTVDGHDYIEQSIKNGAKKIICEHGSYPVETIVVKDSEKYLNEYLVKEYSNSFENTKFIGITGTNGKTTTAYLTSQILSELGINNAYIGTIGYYINSKFIKELPNTTPDILEYYLTKGYKGLVIESFGAGGVPNASNNWLPELEKVLQAGVTVVCATQCLYDGVHLDTYPIGVLAKRLGAQSAMLDTIETSVAKLMCSLARK